MKSKFGNINIKSDGYYVISSEKEGNYGKYLHRLIYEELYGEIPQGYVIHHKDHNKLNNCILNLQLMKRGEHSSLHNLNKKIPEKQRRNMVRYGTSVIEEWGGLWFLKTIKKQIKTMKQLEEYTGITISTVASYLNRRNLCWSEI